MCVEMMGLLSVHVYKTVEPLIVDPPNKGHNRNNLSIKDAYLGPECSLSHTTNTYTTSKQEDISTKDKMAGPNMSFIRRFHCISLHVFIDFLITYLKTMGYPKISREDSTTSLVVPAYSDTIAAGL